MNTRLPIPLGWQCFALATLLGVLAPATASLADPLLVLSNRDGAVFEAFGLRADGSSVRRLLRERGEVSEARWSPDGRSVVLTARRDGRNNIHVVSIADGGGRRLTDDRVAAHSPTWSPDGKSIAFVSMRDNSRKIYLMDADGANQRRLTRSSNDELAPQFSPDGGRVAYLSSDGTSNPRVTVIDLASGTTKVISQDRQRNFETPPVWSPDGRRLVFSSVQGRHAHLVVINADGSDRNQITSGSGRNNDARWSPDGSRLLFAAVRGASSVQDLLTINADGSQEAVVLADGTEHLSPRWSADGRSVYYIALANGVGKLHVVPAAGGKPARLSVDAGSDSDLDVCCTASTVKVSH